MIHFNFIEQIVFEAITGSHNRDDIAIDDVTVYDYGCPLLRKYDSLVIN